LRTCYVDGSERAEDDNTACTSASYNIKLDRLVTTEAYSAAIVSKGTTEADIVWSKTNEGNEPMTGKWRIRCHQSDGTIADTPAMNLDANWYTITRSISEHCPKLINAVHVQFIDNQYDHKTLGKEFYVDFSGYNGDPEQLEIISDYDIPDDEYVGETLTGTGLQFNGETIIEYNKNLLFWPIPFEMLETYEEVP
jgi:hypothetical protein